MFTITDDFMTTEAMEKACRKLESDYWRGVIKKMDAMIIASGGTVWTAQTAWRDGDIKEILARQNDG